MQQTNHYEAKVRFRNTEKSHFQNLQTAGLEVEYPENETSRRRIEFYKRAGLRVWETQKYVQPPYRKGGESLPLLLMATDGLEESSDFPKVMSVIHSNVYGVDM